jgi:hypothetical protein
MKLECLLINDSCQRAFWRLETPSIVWRIGGGKYGGEFYTFIFESFVLGSQIGWKTPATVFKTTCPTFAFLF